MMDPIRMQYDDVAWEKSEDMFKIWRKRLYSGNVDHQVAMLIHKHRQGVPVKLHNPFCGSFNACLRLQFEDGGSGIIRYPVPGSCMFPAEKLHAEVATMRFIADQTTIPVPLVLHVGDQSETPGDLGYFMIMEYVEHEQCMMDALDRPESTKDDRAILDPDVDQEKLETLYGHMAEICLKLSIPSLPSIGCFSETSEFEWSITQRPLTYSMNELCSMGDFPFDRLPQQKFDTASSYYIAMADMHLDHLAAQHNDAIDDEHDCRRKYVARHLFRRLAREGRLDKWPEYENGPFKLFCEDLRPSSVLLTASNTVAGVVDWEFTVAAPVGYAFDPPWWLLLEHPHKWPRGMDDWEKQYIGRLETFLKVLEAREKIMLEKGTLRPDQTLSDRMRTSWETGAFWINYAAQRSFAFEHVYFNRLDEKFFGKVEGDSWLEERSALLSEEERKGMEPFVENKMAQKADRRLPDDRFDALL